MSEDRQLIANRYYLGTLIGRGGMGDVYRGVDSATGHDVAIKLLHESIVEENPDIVDRFVREGEALRQLNHPNIVTLLDNIEEDGRHYLVMEYVSGGSLRDLLDDQSRLPVDAVLNVALDLADALTRAHRLNIIHRDIKPDNVLLAEDGTPRLTDFGVAHIGDRTRLTQTGSVIGTYAYLSPEACNGLELDERTDIWSFGVMLFEMLTGRLPFQETGTAAILTAILTKPAPDIKRLQPSVPDSLVNLIYRMLEKDRNRRISSVRLVGAELEATIRSLDTPLRNLIAGASASEAESRFAPTPSGESEIPAMLGTPEGLTHGFSVYPGAEPTGAVPAYTPGGTPRATGEITVVRGSNVMWVALVIIATILACAAVAVVALIVSPRDHDEEAPQAGSPVEIAPIGEGEYMVLVADLEQLSPDARNVSRFIVDDLTQTLEIGVPFSQVRVRHYPQVITSEEQARTAAETYDATVIIWGNYTADRIEVEVQVGVTTAFEHNVFDRETLEESANVRVHFQDERSESVAMEVLSVLAILQSADNDIYEFMRTLAVIDEVETTPAEIRGTTVAAHIHRFFQTYAEDVPQAIEVIEAAQEEDATNPFLYALDGLALQHENMPAQSQRAAETATRLAPEGWYAPMYLLANTAEDTATAIAYFDRIIAQRPDDWYAISSRGSLYYMTADLDRAQADLETAIALEPPANFPYALAGLVAINQGRFDDALEMIKVIVTEFPDPDLYSRIVGATVGHNDTFSPIISAFVNMVLGRYDEVIESTEIGLELVGIWPDLLVMQGLAYCNLAEYEQAEAVYTETIRLGEEEYGESSPFVSLLRGDVRLQQGDAAGAEADFAVAAQVPALEPLVAGFASGAVNCTNFFGSSALAVGPELPAGPASSGPLPPIDATPVPTESIAPVAPGEYMVLVAQLERLGGSADVDLTRMIVDGLARTLEVDVPFSSLRIREYPGVITSDSRAREVAAETGATVIVWGNYTDDLIELEVQIGIVDAFPYNQFDRTLLERTANLRVHLDDARRQSVAPYVLNVLAILQYADGDGYEALRTGAIHQAITVEAAEIVGNNVAANTHRFMTGTDPAIALDSLDTALELDSGNALLYALRVVADERAGNWEAALRNVRTTERLAPANWALPPLLEVFIMRDDSVFDLFTEISTLRPDDWFPYFFRGTIYFDDRQYDRARADLDQSIALAPNASFPYIYRALLALHEGQLEEAAKQIAVVLAEYPDPAFMDRLFKATFGENLPNPYAYVLSAFTNQVLGRYEDVRHTTIEGLAQFAYTPDLWALHGMAVCALGDFGTAEFSFSKALERSPDWALIQLMRADARWQQDNSTGAERDLAAVEDGPQAEDLAEAVAAVRDHSLNCGNFFAPENPVLGQQMHQVGAEPGGSGSEPVSVVDPVNPGELMILVAEIEPLTGTTERDVARFIIDNLELTLDEEIPNSVLRIRHYPHIIASDAEAVAVASANGATVIVWGNYTDDLIELKVQLGDASSFRYIPFERDVLERTANVRVRLTNERTESVAQQVINIVNLLTMADGDEIGFFLSAAVLDLLDAPSGEVVGNSYAAHMHRGLASYTRDALQAIESYDAAIALDSGNPITYMYRALAYLRSGQDDNIIPDVQTAARLGPDTWTAPMYLGVAGLEDVPSTLAVYDRIIELRPDDWYPYYSRGLVRYFYMGEINTARADMEASIAREPIDKLPYLVLTLIDLRTGDISAAQDLAHFIIRRFPDPEVTNRAMAALYEGTSDDTGGQLIASGTNLMLGRYADAVNSLDPLVTAITELTEEDVAAIQATPQHRTDISDMALILGLAQCNLGQYEAAQDTYTLGLRLDPSHPLLYGLRSEVMRALGNDRGADADLASLDLMFQFETDFTPWRDALEAGTWSCTNFFEFRPAGLDDSEDSDAEATPVALTSGGESIAMVEPVENHQRMVLVAQLEPLDPDEARDVTRFIVSDLRQRFEEEVPYANVVVREYPLVITSDEEARAAALANDATVIVWGNYSDELIELEVQLGAYFDYPYVSFPREMLERNANVSVHLTNERRESVAMQVAGIFSLLAAADGSPSDWGFSLTVADELDVTSGEVTGNSIAAHIQRGTLAFETDPDLAVTELDAAIAIDGSNPIPYIFRGAAYMRRAETEQFVADFNTASRLGPENWALPRVLALTATNPADVAELFTELADARPQDWYMHATVGLISFFLGDLEQAKESLIYSTKLQPPISFPYVTLILISLYEGRIADAQDYARTILTEFADPTMTARVTRAIWRADEIDPELTLFSETVHVIMGQDAQAAHVLQQAIDALHFNEIDPADLPDYGIPTPTNLFLMQGLAHCHQANTEEAEAAFTRAIDFNPDYAVAYVLRGQLRLQSGDEDGAASDFAQARTYELDPDFAGWIDAAESGDWNCVNFFDYALPAR